MQNLEFDISEWLRTLESAIKAAMAECAAITEQIDRLLDQIPDSSCPRG